jgi:alpha,alpha-trehalase
MIKVMRISIFQKSGMTCAICLFFLSFIQTTLLSQSVSQTSCTVVASYYNPATDLKNLFHDVQMSLVFADSKTFVDCTPKVSTDSIAYIYMRNKNDPGFNLDAFVKNYFELPETVSAKAITIEQTAITAHLKSLWNVLLRQPDTVMRGTLLPLSYNYIVPGGRFREIYYWDSYFTMEGLAASGRTDLIKDMLNNFNCMIEQYGYIPNGNRTYFIGRSQPPYFAEMIKLFMRETSDENGLQYLPALEREYQFWMDLQRLRKTTSETGYLNHYSDQNSSPRPEAYKEDYSLSLTLDDGKHDMLYCNIRAACESGWDFSSRWMADGKTLSTIHTVDILPIDLNCLLFNIEATIAELYKIAGNMALSSAYFKKADDRKQLIQKMFWNKKKGFFYDYDSKTNKQCSTESLAAVYPLYYKIATPSMANLVADKLRKDFLQDGGLLTSTINTGQQWDAPNGWAPLQWMAIIGLEKYGLKSLADSIARRWMALNEKVYRDIGKMMEKYNVSDTTLEAGGGEYPGQDGFGWTNGVYLGLYRKGYR